MILISWKRFEITQALGQQGVVRFEIWIQLCLCERLAGGLSEHVAGLGRCANNPNNPNNVQVDMRSWVEILKFKFSTLAASSTPPLWWREKLEFSGTNNPKQSPFKRLTIFKDLDAFEGYANFSAWRFRFFFKETWLSESELPNQNTTFDPKHCGPIRQRNRGQESMFELSKILNWIRSFCFVVTHIYGLLRIFSVFPNFSSAGIWDRQSFGSNLAILSVWNLDSRLSVRDES